MKKIRFGALLLAFALLFQALPAMAVADGNADGLDLKSIGFRLEEKRRVEDGTASYYFKHLASGAAVYYDSNGETLKEFTIGFRTPPSDNSGANHVLEHSLLCGNRKYPSKNLTYYLSANSVAQMINAFTMDDGTQYSIKTVNETDFYNLADVYINTVFYPNLLTEERIFQQQGIRREYADGKACYNGVVYNELRMRGQEVDGSSLDFLSEKMYESVYGAGKPPYTAGGTVEGIKQLSYEDVCGVYRTYYKPSNCIVYLAGEQDIERTLRLLDSYFSELSKTQGGAPEIKWNSLRPAKSEQPVREFGVIPDTGSVSIGLFYAGVPVTDTRKTSARDILLNLVAGELKGRYPSIYYSGGSGGGVSTMVHILAGVPVKAREQAVKDYRDVLEGLCSGLNPQKLGEAIDAYRSPLDREQQVIDGFTYGNDPFLFQSWKTEQSWLKEHPAYFDEVLRECFLENPFQSVTIVGDATGNAVPDEIQLSPQELEQLKKDTEAFNAWVDAPDSPEALANNPVLRPEDFAETSLEGAKLEAVQGVPLHWTQKDKDGRLSLLCRSGIPQADILPMAALSRYLNTQASERGLEGFYFSYNTVDDYHDSEKTTPCFLVGISGGQTAEKLSALWDFLQDETLFSAEKALAFLKSEQGMMVSYFRDPYYLSYEMKMSAQTQGDKFRFASTGSIEQGSIAYRDYINELCAGGQDSLVEIWKRLRGQLLTQNGLTASFAGQQEEYGEVKEQLQALVAELPKGSEEAAAYRFASGYPSAAVVSKQKEDVSHIMLSGYFGGTGYIYSGKMEVMAQLVTANYLIPELRGRLGAYGAGMNFSNFSFTCSCAGIYEIDKALEVFRGIGGFLRSLDITQQELDNMILPVVSQFDEYAGQDIQNGAYCALSGRSIEDFQRLRREILSTTVEDMKGYADFMDEMTAQNRLFAVANRQTADASLFPFDYEIDAGTFRITPRLTREHTAYMRGRTPTAFEPEAPVTRGETAAVLARVMNDQNQSGGIPAPYPDVRESDWFYNSIRFLSEKGILSGYEDGSFRPEQPVTRAEFAAIAAKFIPGDGEKPAQFDDLGGVPWAAEAIGRMTDLGYFKGYEDNEFRPEKTITRAELTAVLNRMLGWAGAAEGENPFTDVDSTHWAYADILAAVSD